MSHNALRRAGAAALLCTALVAASCSQHSDNPPPPPSELANPAVSPQQALRVDGTVYPYPRPILSIAIDSGNGNVVVLGDDQTLSVFNPANLSQPTRTVPVPGVLAGTPLQTGSSALVNVGPSTFALAGQGRVFIANADTAAVTAVPLTGHEQARITSLTAAGSDLYALDADGTVYDVRGTGTDWTLSGTHGSGGAGGRIAAVGNDVAVLDHQRSVLTDLGSHADGDQLGLPIGNGATDLIADSQKRLVAVDTGGGELVVLSMDPFMIIQRYPVPAAPFAVADDAHNQLTWVTRTADNTVVAFDLRTGIPVQKKILNTVRQPDSIAVNPVTGAVLIGSATGDGLQELPHAAS